VSRRGAASKVARGQALTRPFEAVSPSLNEFESKRGLLGLERGLFDISLTACVTGSLPPRRISHDAIPDRMQAQGCPVFFLGRHHFDWYCKTSFRARVRVG
jgi:hypothetical protein